MLRGVSNDGDARMCDLELAVMIRVHAQDDGGVSRAVIQTSFTFPRPRAAALMAP